MNRKGPWEGYRRQARPLSPSCLPLRAHFQIKRETSGYEAAVNNCFSSFIYCFIGWIKYILLLGIQDLRLLADHWYKSSLGLWFFEKLMSHVLKGHDFNL